MTDNWLKKSGLMEHSIAVKLLLWNALVIPVAILGSEILVVCGFYPNYFKTMCLTFLQFT